MAILKAPLVAMLLRFAQRLRFKQLFIVVCGLFLLNLLIPDPIPFIDELILGLLTLLLASWKKDVSVNKDKSTDSQVIDGEVISKEEN